MIIRFYDDEQPSITIDDKRGEVLRKEVNRESPRYISIEGHGIFAKSSIKSMVFDKRKKDPFLALPNTAPDSTIDLSEEERLHKLDMIQKLRENFLKRTQL